MKRKSTLILNHIFWRGLYFTSVLLVNIFIARFFAAEKSGQIFYIVNNLALILLLASLSLESGATYYIASGSLDSSLIARFFMVWGSVASLMALVIWWLILRFVHSDFLNKPWFLPASLLFISGVLYSTYFTALFYAKKEFNQPNKILSFVNILLILILIAGKFYPSIRANFILIYFASFFLQGLLLNVFFFLAEKPGPVVTYNSKAILKNVIRYSLAALVANLIYFLVNRIDYWFVQYFCSEKDLGNYIQASKLGQLLLILPGILGSTLFPIFSSQTKSGGSVELSASIRTLLWINVSLCFLIICFGWYFFPFVFGFTFNRMYIMFVLLIPGILSFTMNYPMAAWFSADKRVGVNIRGGLLALIIICAGDIFILPYVGVLAAPAISSAGYFSYFIFTYSIYKKEHNVPWKEFIKLRKSDINRVRNLPGLNFANPSSESAVFIN